MPADIVKYGTLIITSEELTRIRMSGNLSIKEVETFNNFRITNPGSISPFKWELDVKIRKDSTTKFLAWTGRIQSRVMSSLVIFNRTYPEIYLTNLEITANELNINGDLLWFDMSLSFIQNVNFTS
jgi:hypothetical protein